MKNVILAAIALSLCACAKETNNTNVNADPGSCVITSKGMFKAEHHGNHYGWCKKHKHEDCDSVPDDHDEDNTPPQDDPPVVVDPPADPGEEPITVECSIPST